MKKIILALILATGLAGIGLSACSVPPQNVASGTNTQSATNTQQGHEYHHTD